jgi:hypothetical protein
MTCITTFHGQGGNCATGGPLDNYGTFQFDGYWTTTSHQQCGHSWLSPMDKNGVKHPNADYWSFYPATLTVTYSGCDNDSPTSPNQPCDCVNGGCVPKATYSTPGKYDSLAACQSACAKDSPCNGECISAAEIAALQQAANKAQANCCK